MHAGPPAMSPLLIVVLLALLLGMQPVTTDVYLPALPAIQAGFGASVAEAQATFSALLLAFGLSQLVWGPLSDRFGRRPILLVGVALYVLASAACALAPDMDALVAARVAQGAALGSAVTCARAIVRDLHSPLEAARTMSKGLSGLGVIAISCAPIGGLLTDWLGWRAALAACAAFGLGTLGLLALRFRETIPQRNLGALRVGALWHNWSRIAIHPTFISCTLLATFTFAGLFVFLVASSFVLIQALGLSKLEYGGVMAFISVVYIGGTVVCRRLLRAWGMRRTVAAAGGLSLLSGVLMAGLAWFGWGQPWYGAWAVVLPQALYMIGHGVHQPVGQSGAVASFPLSAGAASALSGVLMMATAFGIGLWLGHAMDGTARPMATAHLLCCVVLAFTAWVLMQRHGDAPAH